MAISHVTNDSLVVENGNFILLKHIVVKNQAIYTCLLTFSGQEWQFYITTDM